MVVKSKRRLCGVGAALANAPLVQDKSYFEVKIQTGGVYVNSAICICNILFYMYTAMSHVYCRCMGNRTGYS